jgi:tetratricopeptide (TPR) repeat protein
MANRAVELDPKDASALNTRGWIYYKLKDLKKATDDFDKAIQFAPKLALPYTNRGVVYTELKQYENAIKDFNRSLALQPAIAIVFINRGNAWMNSGDYARAKEDYAKALELAPKIPESQAAMAWFLATCPDDKFRDGKQAVELATKLCEDPNVVDTNYLHTLAAAQAEAGNFEAAVKAGEQAVAKATDDNKVAFESDLKRLREKQPLRHEGK